MVGSGTHSVSGSLDEIEMLAPFPTAFRGILEGGYPYPGITMHARFLVVVDVASDGEIPLHPSESSVDALPKEAEILLVRLPKSGHGALVAHVPHGPFFRDRLPCRSHGSPVEIDGVFAIVFDPNPEVVLSLGQSAVVNQLRALAIDNLVIAEKHPDPIDVVPTRINYGPYLTRAVTWGLRFHGQRGK